MSGTLFTVVSGSTYRGEPIAAYKDGIVYKASYGLGEILRGEPIAAYKDGIVYKASYGLGEILHREPVAIYEGESDGAAAATAAMLLGLINSHNIGDQSISKHDKDDTGDLNNGCASWIGYLSIALLVAIIGFYIYLPLVVGAMILIVRIYSTLSRRRFNLTFRNTFQGVLFGIGAWLLSCAFWEFTLVIPGILTASSDVMHSILNSMLPYMKLSFYCYIPMGILWCCDEKDRPNMITTIIILIASLIGTFFICEFPVYLLGYELYLELMKPFINID